MEMTPAWFFGSTIVGGVGLGLYLFGKRELRLPQLVTGLTLMIYPVFVSSASVMLGIGTALVLGLWLALRLGL